MKRNGSAIVQRKQGWYGISLTAKEKEREVVDLTLYADSTLENLKAMFNRTPYTIAIDNASGYLFNLSFPFTGRRKIGLVIGNALEEALPFSVEDMTVDFRETAPGKVLAAVAPRSVIDELNRDRRARAMTFHSLAALYALKWFNGIRDDDFVFLHFEGNAAVIMGFKAGALHYLRQFYYSSQVDVLSDALQEVVNDRTFSPSAFYMINGNDDAAMLKSMIESTFKITINTPSLKDFVRQDGLPEWLWAGVGSALLALNPRNEISLSEAKRGPFTISNKAAVYATASLAAVSLLICGLLYLDYYLKQGVYDYLRSEPTRVYRQTFPKSPPVRDVVKAFQDKIKALDGEQGLKPAQSLSPLSVLNEISSKIDSQIDVKLNEFTCDDKEFSMAGTTISFGAAEKIKSKLEEIKGVSAVEIQNIDLTGARQVKFKVGGKI